MLQSTADLSTYNACHSVVLYRETIMLQSTADLTVNTCHSVVLHYGSILTTLLEVLLHCPLANYFLDEGVSMNISCKQAHNEQYMII
jgi:hypothetical protein